MLMIGVLKSLSRFWPLAQRGLTQVRMYAKEVLQRPMDSTAAPLPVETSADIRANEDDDADLTQIDISWMDDLLQQPMHGMQSMHSMQPLQTTPTPLSYDNYLNL